MKNLYLAAIVSLSSVLSSPLSAQVTILSETFESPLSGWAIGDRNFQAYWGRVYYTFGTPYPHTGNYSGYCAGVGYGGTSTVPSYQDDMDAYLRRSFTLAGYSSGTLTFWYTIQGIDAGFDFFQVWIDSNLVFFKSAYVPGWTQVTIDLSPYLTGTHTLEFNFTSDFSCVDEGVYIDDITITASASGPNLTPYKPTGWSDKIVVSKTTGTTADSNPWITTDSLYVDCAIANSGSQPINTSFTNELYLDAVLRRTWVVTPPLNAGTYAALQDYSLGTLSAGTHTIQIKADVGNKVSESNETDNDYTKTIIVGTYPVSAQWEGLSSDQTSSIPPDPHGAAGPNGVLQSVNTILAYFDKSGSLIWGPVELTSFWASVGFTGDPSDPKVLYDPGSGRFYVILQENTSSRGYMNLAVSKSAHPLSSGTADWYLYRFDVTETAGGSNYGPDYPGFGIDGQAVYVSCNMYPFPDGAFKNTELIILNKSAIASGVGTMRKIFTSDGSDSFTLQPVSFAGGVGPGNVAYFVSRVPGTGTQVRLWALPDPLGSGALTSATVSIPDNGGSISDAPQAGTTLTLDTLSDRAQGNAFWYNGAIWFCNTAGGSSGRAKVYYYKLNANGFPSNTPTLAESGAIDGGSGVWTFQPAIGGNPLGDVCLVYCQSSASTFPTIMYTARAATAGSFAAPSELKPSAAYYDGSSNLPDPGRWGDFSTVSVDPSDGSFWITHEWSRSSAPDDWGTWWGRLPVITPLPALRITKQGVNALLQWPGSAPGFTLQWTPKLPAMVWSNATPLPSLVGGQYTVTNAATNLGRFYRLGR